MRNIACIVVSSSGDRRIDQMQKGGGGASSSAVVVRMGPCGGDGGGARDMDMRGVGRVVRVAVRHGAAVDAMSVLYERNGHEEWTDLWGGPGGTLSEVLHYSTSFILKIIAELWTMNVKARSLFFIEWRRYTQS